MMAIIIGTVLIFMILSVFQNLESLLRYLHEVVEKHTDTEVRFFSMIGV